MSNQPPILSNQHFFTNEYLSVVIAMNGWCYEFQSTKICPQVPSKNSRGFAPPLPQQLSKKPSLLQ